MKNLNNLQIVKPNIDIFNEYDHVRPMKHLPRPQPSDIIVSIFDGLDNQDRFFIDVGAHDGIVCSNTLVLEQGYQWNGICIEPNKVLFDTLKEFRKSKCLNVGISTEEEILEFAQISGECDQLSGFIKYFTEEHKNRINAELSTCPQNFKKVLIESTPLENIVNKYNLSKIDYLSIDAECADFEVIKSLDFNKTDVLVLSHEAQDDKTKTNSDIKKYLEQYNFSFLQKCCADNIFVNLKYFSI